MAESVPTSLVDPGQVAREAEPRRSANGIAFASFGDTRIEVRDLERLVQAVPDAVAKVLDRAAYFFVPLAISRPRAEAAAGAAEDETLVAPVYTAELSDQATCHRNVLLGAMDAVFISARLLSDRFALSFEFFINVGHGYVELAGVAPSFAELVWKQAAADLRGETSQDAWEHRGRARGAEGGVDEKEKQAFAEAAFADALAIDLLSLTVDFDYAELREREYPLLAPAGLAERLRLVAGLFPPNPGYEFAIRYRRRG